MSEEDEVVKSVGSKGKKLSREEKELLRAKTELIRAEMEEVRTLTRANLARAEAIEYETDGKRRANEELLSRDFFHHIYRFDTPVDTKTVKEAEYTLTQWDRRYPGCEVTIYFTSPGGSIVDGMAFWDFLEEFKANGHRLTTVSQGMAASMAGILLQAGDHRVIGKESYILIHQANAGVMGSYGDIQDRVKWLDKIHERILTIFENRTNMTRDFIQEHWERTDWWIDSEEALERGLVDEVR